jgi:hypothetical protein
MKLEIILLICICSYISAQAQEKIPNHFFKLEIEEYDYPVRDTFNGFGWFYEYKGDLINIVTYYLNTTQARVRVNNNPNKFIHIQSDNKVEGLGGRNLTLDILKAKYKFSVRDIYDSVDVVVMSVISDSILIKERVKIYYNVEIDLKWTKYWANMNAEERKEKEDSINKIWSPPKLNINNDSVYLGHVSLCSIARELEDNSNLILDCRIEGYDNTEGQLASNGIEYAKYVYAMWVKKTLLQDFESLKNYFAKKGLKLEKHRRLELLKLIEFEPPNKD